MSVAGGALARGPVLRGFVVPARERWVFRRFGLLLACLGIAVAMLQGAATPVTAQTPVGPVTPQQSAPAARPVLGDACTRKSDSKPGIVKRDACARWYCGDRDVKDIIERHPAIATAIRQATRQPAWWQLVARGPAGIGKRGATSWALTPDWLRGASP